MTDAQTEGAAEKPTQETAPAAEAAPALTASTQEAAEFTPEALPEKERGKLLKWADNYAAEVHRKRLGEIGQSVARVPEEYRNKLRQNPNLVAELEAEAAALRRALAGGGGAGVNGQAKPEEEKDDIEADVKAFLGEQGYTGSEDGYQNLLRYEVSRWKRQEARVQKRTKAPDLDKVVDEKLTKRQAEDFNKKVASQFARIQESPEFLNPDKGALVEGLLHRKVRENAQQGTGKMPEEIFEEVKREVFGAPKPAAKAAKLSMGETSSGKVAATAGSDPFAPLHAELKAQGIDPEKF